MTGDPLLYKKLDSALRGNPGSECEAILEVTGAELCIVAPAVPRLRRTTSSGVQRIDGIPVHETEMGRDPMNPVLTSEVAAVLAQSSRYPDGHVAASSDPAETAAALRLLASQGKRYAFCDALTDEHLDNLVSAGGQSGLRLVWAGAAGLGQALAKSLDRRAPQEEQPEPAAFLGENGAEEETSGS
ncbi:four-carbon acid sugar kinase family protein [Paenibacillus sp. CC-CFT747]|nr:four-carbon acid sugar kinase family protein [Paenibacillus sp. CC-CFT747]